MSKETVTTDLLDRFTAFVMGVHLLLVALIIGVAIWEAAHGRF